MAIPFTPETILLFIVFATTIYFLYRLFQILIKASIITLAAFSFPWIVKLIGLPLTIPTTLETGLEFAVAGLLLFLVYEFFHFIVHFLKLITWPIRSLFRSKK